MPMDGSEIMRFASMGFVIGVIGMVSKKLDIAKEVTDLIMLAGYIYMLIFIVQMLETLLGSLEFIFPL